MSARTTAAEAPAEGAGEREEIARIMDPKGWETRDRQYEAIKRSTMHDKDRPLAFENADYYTRDSLTKADAILALRDRSSAPEAREGRRHPLPASLLDDSNTEAMEWITKNAMAIRRDNGDMDYSLGAMIAAYKAGKDGSKLKAATLKDVLLAAARSSDLHMSDRLALEWCAEQPEALAALKAAAEGRDVIGAGGPMDTIIDGQVSDAMIRRMVEAHDTEEAAQKGEPSPWREDLGAVDDPEWVSERMTAMRCAVEAVHHGGEPAPGAWMFRVDGKWELSLIDPRDHLHLAPEDVISVPISAQPSADFVAKAKHLLSLAEEAEDKALVGDEGCIWPVEALRAAYAALPFVMTITIGGEDA